MKMTIREGIPVQPPKTVILELSESEAGLVYYFAGSASADAAACHAANRLREKLSQFKNSPVYPYDKDFR